MRALTLIALLTSLVACGATQRSTLTPRGGFSYTLGRDHPLAGKVWSRAVDELVKGDELLAAVDKSSFLLLGETHDNADQHRLQALLLERFLAAHPHAHVGFEMIDAEKAPALAPPLPQTADELAQKLAWDESGWPDFALYRPVFEVLLRRGAVIFAAHPNREQVMAAMHTLDEAQARALDMTPLPQSARAELVQEIKDGHCGYAPEAMIEPMVRAQTFKDAFMARSMRTEGPPVALIAGRGHVREDRGVPYYLAQRGLTDVLTVGLVDVDDQRVDPRDYEVSGFDFVLFTPRATDASACERFKEQLARMKHGQSTGERAPDGDNPPKSE